MNLNLEPLREKLKQTYGEAQAAFLRLNPRERVMVSACAGVVSLFLLFFLFFSLSNSGSSIQRHTTTKLQKLQLVQQLAANFREADAARQAAERQLSQSNVSLLSYLEETGKKSGLDIPTMNPKGDVAIGDEGKIIESSVELTLTDVPLNKLIDFLSSVERGPGVLKVKFLRLEPRPANEVLTAWVTVSAYRLKESP